MTTKVTAAGVGMALLILYPSMCCCLGYVAFLMLLAALLRRGLGDRLAAPALRAANWLSASTGSAWFALPAIGLEVLLGTRLAWTVVDERGQEALQQQVGLAADKPAEKNGKYVPLDRVLLPPSAPGQSKIIIMNHHCRLDWFYLFPYLARTRNFSSFFHIIMKRELRGIPVIGWGMQCFRFLFISRKWERDQPYLRSMIEYIRDTNDRNIIFIFPEGTDLSPSNIEKSQAFAAREGLPTYQHVLNPRTTGTVAIAEMLGGAAAVEEIIDMTVGYTYVSPGVRPTELSLVNGRQTPKVHLLVRSWTVEGNTSAAGGVRACSAPAPVGDHDRFSQWIHDRFTEKEQLMSRFAQNNPVGFDAADVRAVYGPHCGVVTYDMDDEASAAGASSALPARLRRCLSQIGPRTLWAVVFFYLIIPFVVFRRGLFGGVLGASHMGIVGSFFWFNVSLALNAAVIKGVTVACGEELEDLWMLKKTPEDKSWLSQWKAAKKQRKD